MRTASRGYSRYSRQRIYEILEHHERAPHLTFRKLALLHGISCPETVRYWLRTYRTRQGLKKRKRR